jgi:hypothetical protein
MDLDVPMIAVKLLTGLVIGASIGLTGIGGGVLVLPTLTLLFGLPPTVAVGTANLYSFLCKLSATYFHYKQKTIAFGTSGYFLMGAIPANLAVSIGLTWYAASLQEDEAAWQAFQANLHRFIALIVIVSALLILWNLVSKPGSRAPEPRTEGTDQKSKKYKQTAAAVMMGVVIGALIASTSVGGGILIVPMLIIIFGLSAVETVGSSVFIALILTLLSSLVYAGSSQLDLSTAIIMAAGSFVGVPLGVRYSKKLSDRLLQLVITGIVCVAGALMLWA